MKRTILPCLLLSLALPGLASQVFDFNLVNKTGREIHRIYISPLYYDEWSEYVFDSGGLPAQGRRQVSLDSFEGAILRGYGLDSYDLKAEFPDGASVVFHGLKLLDVESVELRIDKDGHAAASWK